MAGADAAPRVRHARRLWRRAGAELWLDGGHNADGGRAIAAALGDLEERVSRPLVLIVGMLAQQGRDGFLRNFTGLARRMFAVPIPIRRTRCRPDIAAAARALDMPAEAAASIEAALRSMARSASIRRRAS